eukprot:scaffold124541_cov23-Tisochrysis_lutea.AAC.1
MALAQGANAILGNILSSAKEGTSQNSFVGGSLFYSLSTQGVHSYGNDNTRTQLVRGNVSVVLTPPPQGKLRLTWEMYAAFFFSSSAKGFCFCGG